MLPDSAAPVEEKLVGTDHGGPVVAGLGGQVRVPDKECQHRGVSSTLS